MKTPLTIKNRISAFTSGTHPRVRVSKTEVTGEFMPQIVEQPTTAVVSPSENQHTRHRMEEISTLLKISILIVEWNQRTRRRMEGPNILLRIGQNSKQKTLQSRLILLDQWKIGTRCVLSTNHSAKECQVKLRCSHCDSTRHCSALNDASCDTLEGLAGRQFTRDLSNSESVGWASKALGGATLSD